MMQEEIKLMAADTAKKLRDSMTKGECHLWEILKRHNKKFGTTWQCQVPIVVDMPVKKAFSTKPFYVADFIETTHRIIIEVDGDQHEWSSIKEKDNIRDTTLEMCGFKTYRITSLDVWRRNVLKEFLDKIYNMEALSPWYS